MPSGEPPLLASRRGVAATDRPPTAAMKRFADSIGSQKGIKPPPGYTKSGAICRAFLQEHAPKKVGDEHVGHSGPKSASAAEVAASTPGQPNTQTNTPLRIPYGNKELAQKLGARYGAGGWYAPPGVDLAAFDAQGWL